VLNVIEVTKPSTVSPTRPWPPSRAEQDALSHRPWRQHLAGLLGVERHQVVDEHRRGFIACPDPCEGAIDDADEVVREIRPALGQRLAPAADVGLDDLVDRPAFDGILPGDEIVEQHADAVDIACCDAAAPARTSGAVAACRRVPGPRLRRCA
jgi:hypothetical protein